MNRRRRKRRRRRRKRSGRESRRRSTISHNSGMDKGGWDARSFPGISVQDIAHRGTCLPLVFFLISHFSLTSSYSLLRRSSTSFFRSTITNLDTSSRATWAFHSNCFFLVLPSDKNNGPNELRILRAGRAGRQLTLPNSTFFSPLSLL